MPRYAYAMKKRNNSLIQTISWFLKFMNRIPPQHPLACNNLSLWLRTRTLLRSTDIATTLTGQWFKHLLNLTVHSFNNTKPHAQVIFSIDLGSVGCKSIKWVLQVRSEEEKSGREILKIAIPILRKACGIKVQQTWPCKLVHFELVAAQRCLTTFSVFLSWCLTWFLHVWYLLWETFLSKKRHKWHLKNWETSSDSNRSSNLMENYANLTCNRGQHHCSLRCLR